MADLEFIKQAVARQLAVYERRPTAARVRSRTVARRVDGLRCQVEDGEWRLEVDQPRLTGGDGRAGDPGVIGRAALASCMVQSYVIWFARLGVPVGDIEVEVEAHSDARGALGIAGAGPAGYEHVVCRVRIASDADPAAVRRAVEAADRYSPWLHNFTQPLPLARELEIGPAGAALHGDGGHPILDRGSAADGGMSEGYRGYHDMGGQTAGAVDRHEHDSALWEKRVDALMRLLSDEERRLIRVDELRRAIESLGAEAYEAMSYYERWVSAIASLMLEKGVIGRDELEARIARLKARGAGRE